MRLRKGEKSHFAASAVKFRTISQVNIHRVFGKYLSFADCLELKIERSVILHTLRDLQEERYPSALTCDTNNLGRGLETSLNFISSTDDACAVHVSVRGNCRSTWNFCPLLPLSLTNFPPPCLLRVATRPHRDELFPPWGCLQFSRKPSNFEPFADVCEPRLPLHWSPINK